MLKPVTFGLAAIFLVAALPTTSAVADNGSFWKQNCGPGKNWKRYSWFKATPKRSLWGRLRGNCYPIVAAKK